MKPIFLLGVLTAGLPPIGLQNIPGKRLSVASLKGTCIWQKDIERRYTCFGSFRHNEICVALTRHAHSVFNCMHGWNGL